MSLRSRIVWSYIAIALVVLALSGLVLFFFVRHVNHTEARRQESSMVQQAQELANVAGVVIERQAAGEVSAGRLGVVLNSSALLIRAVVVVTDANGNVVAPRNPLRQVPARIPSELRPEAEPRMTETRALGGGTVAVAGAPLPPNDLGYDAVYVVKPVSELGAAGVPTLYYYLLVAAAVALLASLALALYLSYSLTKPVRELKEAAEGMAAGDLEQEVSEEGPEEMAELSRSFNYMARRLREASQGQKEFVANVSHELRTPLTSIEGFSLALLEGLGDEQKRVRYAEIISQESRRMKGLLDALLQLSSLDAGGITLHPESVNVTQFLSELRDRFAPIAADAEISLDLELDPGLPALVTDRDRLAQILTNLLDNAIKYTGAGGRVTLAARAAGGEVALTVSDTGVGIAPEDLPFVFDRFFRVERSRAQEYGGAGLGLAISRSLAEALGGRLSVASQPGQGTVFTLIIGSGQFKGGESVCGL